MLTILGFYISQKLYIGNLNIELIQFLNGKSVSVSQLVHLSDQGLYAILFVLIQIFFSIHFTNQSKYWTILYGIQMVWPILLKDF